MGIQIASVSIGTKLDLTGFNQGLGSISSIQAPQAMVKVKIDASSIEKERQSLEKLLSRNLTIKVKADHSELYELNKHIELKRNHARDVNSWMGKNPIKVRVDDSDLKELNKKIENQRTHVNDVNDWMEDNPIKIKTYVETIDEGALESQIEDIKNRLEVSLKINVKAVVEESEKEQIKTSIKNGIDDGFKGASNTINDATNKNASKTSVFGSVTSSVFSPFKQALAGAFSGIGLPIGEKIGKGISKGAEKRHNIDFEKVGSDLENYLSVKSHRLTDAALNNIGLSAEKINKDIIGFARAIDTALEPEPISKAVKKAETLLVKVLEDAFVFKNFKNSKAYAKEQLIKVGEKAKEGIQSEEARPYTGAALRVAAYPFKIRRSIEATRQYQEAEKMAEGIQVEDIGDAKSLTLAIAGKNNVQGAGSAVIAPEIQKLTGEQSHVVPVANPYTDSGLAGMDYFVEEILAKADKGILGAVNNLLKQRGIEVEKLSERLTGEKSFAQAIFKQDKSGSLLGLEQMITTGAVLGHNPDSVSATAHAIAYRKKYPDLPINIVGHSGGGEVAQGSAEMLSKGGIQANAVGLGTPTTGLVYAGNVGDQKVNYTSLMGDKDYINWQFFDDKGMTPSMKEEYGASPLPGMFPKSLAPIIDVPKSGALHSLPAYLGGKSAQQAMAERLEFAIPSITDEHGNVQANVSKDYQSSKPFEFIRDRELKAETPIKAIQTLTGEEISAGELKRSLRDVELVIEHFSAMKKGTGEAKKDAEDYIAFLGNVHTAIKETLAQGAIPSAELKTALDTGANFHKPIAEAQKELSPVLEKNIASEQSAKAERQAKEAKAKAEADAIALANKTNLYRYPEAVKGAINLAQDVNAPTRDLIESKRDITTLITGLKEDSTQLVGVTERQINQYIEFLETVKSTIDAVLNGEPLQQLDFVISQSDSYFNKLAKEVEGISHQALDIPEKALSMPIKELKQPELEAIELTPAKEQKKQELQSVVPQLATPDKLSVPILPSAVENAAIDSRKQAEAIAEVQGQVKKTISKITKGAGIYTNTTLQAMENAVDEQTVVDLKTKVANIRDATKTAESSLAGGSNVSKAYAETVLKLVPDIEKQIQSGLAQLSPQERLGSEMGNQLANLKSSLVKVQNKAKNTLAEINKPLNSQGTQLEPRVALKGVGIDFEAHIKSARALAKTDSNAAKQSAQAILQTADEARNAIDEILATMGEQAGLDIKGAAKTARQKITRAINGANEILGESKDIGTQVSSGLTTGLTGSISQVKNASALIAQATIDSAKETLDIHSPSKVFEKLGKFVVEGFQQGLETIQGVPSFVGGFIDESTQQSNQVPKQSKPLGKIGINKFKKEASILESQINSFISEIDAQIAIAKADEQEAKITSQRIDRNQQLLSRLNKDLEIENTLRINGKGNLAEHELEEIKKQIELVQNLTQKAEQKLIELDKPEATVSKLSGLKTTAKGHLVTVKEISSRKTIGTEQQETLSSIKNELGLSEKEANKPLNNESFLSKLGFQLPNVLENVKGLVKGFLGFTVVMWAQNLLGSFSKEAIEAATAMESLERRFYFASGSAQKGASNLAFVRAEVKRLGTDIKSSMEGFVGLAAGTKDTALESQTQKIFSGVSQASTVYDLNAEQQGRVFTAVQQIASKGKVSAEELRQQLGESLPGAFQIAARAMGMTTTALDKMMSEGKLLSEDFLPKFAQQLSAETALGVKGAANSSVSALIAFNNALFEMQATLGKTMLPVRNFLLSIGGKAFDFISQNAELLLRVFQSLSIIVGIKLAGSFVQLASSLMKIPMVAKVATAAMTTFNNAVPMEGNKLRATQMVENAGGMLGNISASPVSSIKQGGSNLGNSIKDFGINALDSAKAKIGTLAESINNFRTNGLNSLSSGFGGAATNAKAFGKAALVNGVSGMMGLAQGARALIGALAPMLKMFIVIEVGMGVFKGIQAAFSDSSGASREFADTAVENLEKYKKALSEARGETQKFQSSTKVRDESLLDEMGVGGVLPKSIKEDAGWFDKLRFGTGKVLTGLVEAPANLLKISTGGRHGATYEDKKLSDNLLSASDARGATNSTSSEMLTMLGGKGKGTKELGELKKYDDALREIQTRRAALVAINPEDKAGLKLIDEEQNKILAKREKVSKPIGMLQANMQTNIDGIKKEIEKYEKLASEPGKNQAQYKELLGGLKGDLSAAEKIQDRFNKSVGESVNSFTLMQRNIQGVADKLSDAEDKSVILGNSLKSKLYGSVRSQGELQFGLSDIELKQQESKLARLVEAKNQTSALLQNKDAQNTLSAYGVTENTGKAELKTLAEKASERVNDKYVLEQYASLQEKNVEISNLQAGIAQSKQDLTQKIFELNKQINEYYRNAAKQFAESSIQFQQQTSQLKTQSYATTLRSALTTLQDNIVSTFVESIIESVQQLSDAADKKFDIETAVLQADNQFKDALKQGDELKRQLPKYEIGGSEAPTISVSLDFSTVGKNADLDKLNTEIGKTVDKTKELTTLSGDYPSLINESIGATQSLGAANSDVVNNVKGLETSLGDVNISISGNIDSASELGLTFGNNISTAFELGGQIDTNTKSIQSNNSAVLDVDASLNTAIATTGNVDKATGTWLGTTGKITTEINTNVNGGLTGVTGSIEGIINKTIDWFKTFANNIPILNQLGQIFAGWGQQLSGVAQSITGVSSQGASSAMSANAASMLGRMGEGVGNVGKYEIFDSNYGHNVTDYEKLSRHHALRGIENRDYGIHGGKQEEVRKTSDGRELVKKDFVLEKNGSSAVDIPAMASGYIQRMNDATDGVRIYADKAMTKLVGQSLHMKNISVKDGDFVKYGQRIGTQGDTGSPGAIHAHIEMEINAFKQYIQDLKDGVFEGSQPTTVTEQKHSLGDGHNHYGEEDIKKANLDIAKNVNASPSGNGMMQITQPVASVPSRNYIPRGGSIGSAERVKADPEGARAMAAVAQRLKLPVDQFAALMSWESGGTYNPNVMGGDGGAYKGLIQFSPDNQAKYKTGGQQSISEQILAVEQYLKDRGYKPGQMDIRHAYSAVLAGTASEKYWDSADSNGTTARNAAPKFQKGEHYDRAVQFLKDSGLNPSNPGIQTAPSLGINAAINAQPTGSVESWKTVPTPGVWTPKGIVGGSPITNTPLSQVTAKGNEAVNKADGMAEIQRAKQIELAEKKASNDAATATVSALKNSNKAFKELEKGLRENGLKVNSLSGEVTDTNEEYTYGLDTEQKRQQAQRNLIKKYDTLENTLIDQRKELDTQVQSARAILDKGGIVTPEMKTKVQSMVDSPLIGDPKIRENLKEQLQKALSTGALGEGGTKLLERAISEGQAQVGKIDTSLDKVRKGKEDSKAFLDEKFAREEKLRKQSAGFDVESASIDVLKAKMEQLQALQSRSPFAPEVKAIPSIQKVIAAREEQLRLEQKLRDIEEKEKTKVYTKSEADALRKEVTSRKAIVDETIKSNAVQAEAVLLRETENRNREASIELANSELNKDKQKLEQLKLIAQTNPLSPELSNSAIPQLEKKISLKEAELKLTQDIAAIEQEAFENKRTPEEVAKKKTDTLSAYETQVKNINTQASQAIFANEISQQKTILEIKKQQLDYQTLITEATSKAINLGLKQGDPLRLNYDSQRAQMQLSVESQVVEMKEFANKTGKSKEEVAALEKQIRDLNGLNLDNLAAEFKKSVDDRAFGIRQRLGSSGTEVLEAKASFYSGRGMNFKAQDLQRQSAMVQQQSSYEGQKRDLEEFIKTNQVASDAAQQLRDNLEAVNQVKFDTIKDNFNTFKPVIDSVGTAIEDGLVNVFKTGKFDVNAFFDTIFSSMAKLAASWLKEQLLGSIMGGGKNKGKGGMFAEDKKPENPQDPLSALISGDKSSNVGLSPVAPMYVNVVNSSAFGSGFSGVTGASPMSDLFGLGNANTQVNSGNDFLSSIFGGEASFDKSNPFPVGIEKSAPNAFSSLAGTISGIFGGSGSAGAGLGGILGNVTGLLGGGGGGLGGILGMIMPLFGGLFAEGGVIGGSARSKKDDQLILAQKGEGILTHKGMDAIGGGAVLGAINDGRINLPKFAEGGVVGGGYVSNTGEYGSSRTTDKVAGRASEPREVNVKMETTSINGVEYLTKEQGQELAQKAAQEGAKNGATYVQDKLMNSPQYRSRLGIR